MFAKLRQFCYPTVTPVKVAEQHTLDKLRITYALVPAMQLHLDRMQTALNQTA